MAFVGTSGWVSLLEQDVLSLCELRKSVCRGVRSSRRCVLNLGPSGPGTGAPEPEESEEKSREEEKDTEEKVVEEGAEDVDDLINSPLMMRKRIEVGGGTRFRDFFLERHGDWRISWGFFLCCAEM